MKNIVIGVWNTIRNVHWVQVSLFLVFVSIPLYNNLNSYTLVLFSIAGIFTNSFQSKRARLVNDYFWLFSILYFFVIACSVLWDPNGLKAFKSVEKNASFLIIGPVIAALAPIRNQLIKKYLLSFAFSTVLVCLLCLLLAWNEYHSLGDYRVFYYQYLSNQMDMNAIYLSLYAAMSLLVLVYYSFIKSEIRTPILKFAVIVICLFLCVVVLLLSSKMIIFLLCFLIVGTALYVSYLKKFLWQGALLVILFVVGSGALLWQMPYVKWRIQVTILKDYENKDDDQNGLAVRQRIWKNSTDLIAKRPLLGYGIRSGNETLVRKHEETNFEFAAQNMYNSHNLYLQVLLNTGIAGLIPILVLFFLGLRASVRRRSYLFICFMVLVLGLSLTESLLEVQKGIVFVVVFLFMLYYHPPENRDKSIKNSSN